MSKFHYSKSRYIAYTAIFAALSAALMALSFSVPFMPSFIKLDFSEVPALIASFSMGPVSGVLVCLIKNLINVTMTTTSGVGELSNFILGVLFIVPAGLIYKKKRDRIGALIGSVVGSVIMGVLSLLTNYYIAYPVYENFMPVEAIVGMYQEIFGGVNGLWECLLIFNMPYTIFKGLLCAAITFLVYKPVSVAMKTIDIKLRVHRYDKLVEKREKEDGAPHDPTRSQEEHVSVRCPFCGAVIDKEICPFCGARLHGSSAKTSASPTDESAVKKQR